MIQLEEAITRPEFESIDLDITVDHAHEQITEAVRDLNTSESEEMSKYQTADGMLVAIVGTRSVREDGEKAKLAYRIAPPSEPSTRKPSKLSGVLGSSTVD
jgi:hypothetical protein